MRMCEEELVLRECVGGAEQCVLRWFEHMERREKEDQLMKRILLMWEVVRKDKNRLGGMESIE